MKPKWIITPPNAGHGVKGRVPQARCFDRLSMTIKGYFVILRNVSDEESRVMQRSQGRGEVIHFFQWILPVGLLLFLLSVKVAVASENIFNQLILEKKSLENRFGVRTVECFPFMENIGFTENQIPLIKNCLAGVRLLSSALSQSPTAEIHTAGISTRFLRTAGFHTVLIPWNASLEATIGFLKKQTPQAEQTRFLDRITSLKRDIQGKFRFSSLYCSQRISNDQCMTGYESLAAIKLPPGPRPVKWQKLVVDDQQSPGKESHSLRINFDASPQEMREFLLRDPDKEWSFRRRMYEDIQSRYKGVFEKRLQIASYYCSPVLNNKFCLEGMASLFRISDDPALKRKAWGEVVIDRYNTFIKGDHDVSIRFDLSADEIARHFASKPDRAEVTKNTVLAEKLEKRTLNNSSGLRAVCDLEGLRSQLCARAFENFIGFLTQRRDYRVKIPWTEVMFIDGTQLARVNFALNSSSRHSYIYIDAGSDPEEVKTHLMRFTK